MSNRSGILERGADALRRSMEPLRLPVFRTWTLSQLLSASGHAMSAVALAWLVVDLGGSGIELAVVTGAVVLPTLVLGPTLGHIGDIVDRRKLLLFTQSAQMILAGVLAAVSFLDMVSIPLLAILSLVTGVAFAVDQPTRHVFVLDLVGSERTASAVSLNEVVINASRIIGPALGGLALALGEVGWCFVLNAVSFVPPIVVLLRMSPRPVVHAARAPSDAVEGGAWRFAVRNPAVGATLLLAVCGAAALNTPVVMPLMTANVFHADAAAYGLVAAAFGVGALPGALLAATGGANPSGREVRVLALATGVAVIFCALSATLIMLMVTVALVGASLMWFIARANAFVLLQAPVNMRGRIMGLWSVALPGSNTLTGLGIGALADAAGPRVAYATVGALAIIVTAVAWRALRVPIPDKPARVIATT